MLPMPMLVLVSTSMLVWIMLELPLYAPLCPKVVDLCWSVRAESALECCDASGGGGGGGVNV